MAENETPTTVAPVTGTEATQVIQTETEVYSILIGLQKVLTYFIVSGVGLSIFKGIDLVKINGIINLIIACGGIGVLAGVYNFVKFHVCNKKS